MPRFSMITTLADVPESPGAVRTGFLWLVLTSGVDRQVRVPIRVKRTQAKHERYASRNTESPTQIPSVKDILVADRLTKRPCSVSNPNLSQFQKIDDGEAAQTWTRSTSQLVW